MRKNERAPKSPAIGRLVLRMGEVEVDLIGPHGSEEFFHQFIGGFDLGVGEDDGVVFHLVSLSEMGVIIGRAIRARKKREGSEEPPLIDRSDYGYGLGLRGR